MKSVINPTTNINQQGDITINTITEVGVVPIFTFQPDTDVNNRMKVARLAKGMITFPGVESARVGTVDAYRDGKWLGTHREVVEVCYEVITTRNATKRANQPFQVATAYFSRDEELLAATIISNEDAESHFYYRGELIGEETFTAFGKTYGYGYRSGHESIGSALRDVVGHDGNQHEAAERKVARDTKAQAEADQHQTAIAVAYANRPERNRYGHYYAIEAGKGKTLHDAEANATNRAEAREAQQAVVNAFEAQLFTLCLDLDKLRCESLLADRYAPRYEFVTRGEVVAFIMTRWIEDGFGDVERGIRQAVAKEFIRKHLS